MTSLEKKKQEADGDMHTDMEETKKNLKSLREESERAHSPFQLRSSARSFKLVGGGVGQTVGDCVFEL
ncbi:interactor of constitutive active ROPs 2, chloroplastic isoform X3 [Gossypium australe]|uniref:Interactor of constitutive active ROPs 2, chloroplastic isoform X3 n=1 Tax=Gossypium australe TaxID=47621 RepID=A0A5B6UAT9_9ROSI|nr:interactor of constitutive active ROPs 2, chloroplastic isoform X3 [Gossypium australe]